MLVDMLREQQLDFTYEDGYRAQEAFEPVKARLEKAFVYVLDSNAMALAANVALSKPSSLLSALPFAKLPFPRVFIEFSNEDLKRSMAGLGSTNIRPPHTATRLIRSGFLIEDLGDHLLVDYIMAQQYDDKTVVELSPAQGVFDLADVELPDGSAPNPFSSERPEAIRGKMQEHLSLIAKSPLEGRCYHNLQVRFRWRPHPDLARMSLSQKRMMGSDQVEAIRERQAAEARRLFNLAILPTLILLNCRNAVEVNRVDAPEKLNKQRAKKNKPPLSGYNEIRIKLNAARQRMASRPGASVREMTAAYVTGHFKVRRSGIFWWSPHVRMGSLPSDMSLPPKIRKVTA
jgi:hypothetical protein